MKKFDVEITETLQRKVSVEAASQEDAERMVTQAWNNQDYVLDSGDFTGVDFKTVGEHELSESRTMDVLLVQPNAYPKKISVGTELEDLQAMVGGDIEVTYPFEDEVAIILNESGKINGLPLNRAIYTEDGDMQDIYETFQNPVDQMFEALKKKKPNHFAVRQYAKFKLAAGKTLKSILVSCGARLAPFDIEEVRDITMYDELSLDTVGDKKTALFLIMSDTDPTFNFLISMIYTQLFNLLCEKADDVYGGRLPVHVRCLIDECANIGQIPNLEKLVATIRSREISACLVLQAQSQLKAIYKDNADTIIGNMDSRIFLGGSEPTTLKELNQALGKETIDLYNTSDTRGNSPSYGTNYQKVGHDLASVDELSVLDGGKCILQLRGVRPFKSDKYDLTQHPNYKLTAGADKKNTFSIEAFLDHRLKLKPGDKYEVVDADHAK